MRCTSALEEFHSWPDMATRGIRVLAFLFAEYTYTAVFILLFSVSLAFFAGVLTTVGRVVGALTSSMFSWIGPPPGIHIAVLFMEQAAHPCWKSLTAGSTWPSRAAAFWSHRLSLWACWPSSLVESSGHTFTFEHPGAVRGHRPLRPRGRHPHQGC